MRLCYLRKQLKKRIAMIEELNMTFEDGKTVINKEMLNAFQDTINLLVRFANNQPETYDPKTDFELNAAGIRVYTDRALQAFAGYNFITWLDTDNVMHFGDGESNDFPAYSATDNPKLTIKAIYGIGANTTTLGNFIRGGTNCRNLQTKYWTLSNITSFNNFAVGVYNDMVIDTSLWDCSNITSASDAFRNLHLYSFLGGIDSEIDIDAQTDVKCWNNIAVSLDFTNSNTLPRASIIAMFRGLATLPSGTSRTITLNSTAKGRLSDADKAIATNKGWTIA